MISYTYVKWLVATAKFQISEYLHWLFENRKVWNIKTKKSLKMLVCWLTFAYMFLQLGRAYFVRTWPVATSLADTQYCTWNRWMSTTPGKITVKNSGILQLITKNIDIIWNHDEKYYAHWFSPTKWWHSLNLAGRGSVSSDTFFPGPYPSPHFEEVS